MTKVFDIVQPRYDWEHSYAQMEYERIRWQQLWQPCTWIEVKDAPTPTHLKAIQAYDHLQNLAKEMGWA